MLDNITTAAQRGGCSGFACDGILLLLVRVLIQRVELGVALLLIQSVESSVWSEEVTKVKFLPGPWSMSSATIVLACKIRDPKLQSTDKTTDPHTALLAIIIPFLFINKVKRTGCSFWKSKQTSCKISLWRHTLTSWNSVFLISIFML